MGEGAALRTAIVEACRSMAVLGLTQGMAGNISVRDGEAMLITPSAVPYAEMEAGDIAVMELAGAAAPSRGPLPASSEWHFHRDILRTRPELGAIVHAHAPFCTALSMARRGIPACHYMIANFGGDDVRCAGYATFGTPELSAAVLAALEGRSACLMANHGMLACGGDLAQAMRRAVELEALAGQYHASLAFGGPVLLTTGEMDAAVRRFGSYGRR